MFGYMSDLSTVQETDSHLIEAEGAFEIKYWCACPLVSASLGHDMESLLFHFLDEFLFAFSADPFFIPKVS